MENPGTVEQELPRMTSSLSRNVQSHVTTKSTKAVCNYLLWSLRQPSSESQGQIVERGKSEQARNEKWARKSQGFTLIDKYVTNVNKGKLFCCS